MQLSSNSLGEITYSTCYSYFLISTMEYCFPTSQAYSGDETCINICEELRYHRNKCSWSKIFQGKKGFLGKWWSIRSIMFCLETVPFWWTGSEAQTIFTWEAVQEPRYPLSRIPRSVMLGFQVFLAPRALETSGTLAPGISIEGQEDWNLNSARLSCKCLTEASTQSF